MDKKITDREKIQKRRAYMKKYYMKRKYQLGCGKTTRSEKKLKELNINKGLVKQKGEFIVTFL